MKGEREEEKEKDREEEREEEGKRGRRKQLFRVTSLL